MFGITVSLTKPRWHVILLKLGSVTFVKMTYCDYVKFTVNPKMHWILLCFMLEKRLLILMLLIVKVIWLYGLVWDLKYVVFLQWPKQLNSSLEEIDPEIADIIELEKARQWKVYIGF